MRLIKNQRFHFSQSDLQLNYYNGTFKQVNSIKNIKNFYILALISGTAKIEYPDKIVHLHSGETFIANKNEMFKVTVKGNHITFFDVWFEAKFFHNLDSKIDILKPFSYSEMDKIKKFSEETQNEHYQIALKNVVRSLISQSSRALVMSSVLQLICEIYYIYHQKNPPSILDTDSSFAKLYKYIDNHIYEKLTMKKVSEGTFLSERTITNILRKIVGMSFHEYVTSARLDNAKKLISSGYYSLVDVASSCGFDTYSTFYRAFKNRFGMSPKEYIKQKQLENV